MKFDLILNIHLVSRLITFSHIDICIYSIITISIIIYCNSLNERRAVGY